MIFRDRLEGHKKRSTWNGAQGEPVALGRRPRSPRVRGERCGSVARENVSARIRFGTDIQKGAEISEYLNVRSLIDFPDRADVRRAWEITLINLTEILDYCEGRGIPLILVIYPFAFQLDNVEEQAIPQRILNQYAIEQGTSVIDLLPILNAKMKREKTKPEDYFMDEAHLSPLGSKVVGEIIADFIRQEIVSESGASSRYQLNNVLLKSP